MNEELYTEFWGSGNNESLHVHYLEVETCPSCHNGITPTVLTHIAVKRPKPIETPRELVVYIPSLDGRPKEVAGFYVINRCPICNHVFLSAYSIYELRANGPVDAIFRLATPAVAKPEPLDPEIRRVSESFVSIYQQAVQAEANHLDQIAGMGYRRALEFLVKDFCKLQHPEDQNIEDMPLAQCIKKYLDYPKLQMVAERAAWLGNDQCHYLKKHTDKDLEDLKTLVKLTMHLIIIDLGVEAAVDIRHS